ncbi:MAG: hypothetical protein LBQ18_05990 [Campylobacteraceae bacterium]|jgi:uncharacterized protein YlxW (UPF0749 family)|nr:hypothetical protein [Campylobacteraceae bacterium]
MWTLIIDIIGKIKPYIWTVAIVVAIVFLMQVKIWLVTANYNACKAENINLLATIRASELLQERQSKEAKRLNDAINKAYNDKLKEIQAIKKETSESDCNGALRILRANF